MPRNLLPMQEGCPWSPLADLRVPNIKWCEAQICGWIVEPANTWSNLGYIAVGIFAYLHARRTGTRSRAIRFYGPAALWVGIFSFLYHASYTFVTQILDFLGMYLYAMLLLMINFYRLKLWSRSRPFEMFWGLVGTLTLLTIAADFIDIPIQLVVIAMMIVIIATEFLIRRKTSQKYPVRAFSLGIFFFLFANVFSVLDHQRILCDPENHWLQGHALMHIFGSIALLILYFHYRQFDEELA